jgi:23S rRNA G2445 N2-methylase RlmL
LVDKKLVSEELELAKSKKFEGEYKIFASDIDEEVLMLAKNNAKEAGVDDIIKFSSKKFEDYLDKNLV